MFTVTLIGSLALIAWGAYQTFKDARRGRAEVAVGHGAQGDPATADWTDRSETPGGDLSTSDAALREDACVEWLESIPVLEHEPERR